MAQVSGSLAGQRSGGAGCRSGDRSTPCVCGTADGLVAALSSEVSPLCPHRLLCGGSLADTERQLRFGTPSLTSGARRLLGLALRGGTAANIAAQVAAGRMVLVHARTGGPLFGTKPTALVEPAPPPAEVRRLTSWIGFRVVQDATGEPIPNVLLRIKLTNGSELEYATRADGTIEVHEINSGFCEVTCPTEGARYSKSLDFVSLGVVSSAAQESDEDTPPDANNAPRSAAANEPQAASAPLNGGLPSSWGVGSNGQLRILEVAAHRVRGGESLKGIAESNGLTWQELAKFNWGTAIPDEINAHLRDDVGCTHKTPDGNNYRFHDSDSPGIIRIPKQWKATGFPTDHMHTIRVQAPQGEPSEINYIRLCVFDDDEQLVPELPYSISDADDELVCEGATDSQGRIYFDDVPLDDFTLTVAGHERVIPSVAFEDEWIDVFLPRLGYIRLAVFDHWENAASGLPFEIVDEHGDVIHSGATDETGRISVDHVALRDYQLVVGGFERTVAAVGYEDEWVDVFLPALGHLRLIVYGDGEKAMAATEYRVTDTDGTELFAGRADGEGRIRHDWLALDDYRLTLGELERMVPAVAYENEWVDVFAAASKRVKTTRGSGR